MSTINTDLSPYIDIEDIEQSFRTLTEEETEKAEVLIYLVSDTLRQEAIKRGKDLDEMLESGELLENVLKGVCIDVVARILRETTDTPPMSQYTESALGYSISGTYLNPGGGIYIKKTELSRLGLLRQRYGALDPWHS